jgi:zinc protease
MPDRSTAPPFRTPEPFAFEHAVSRELGNGLKVHLVRAGRQSLLRLEFLFRAGSRFDAIPGQSYFATRMLSEGSRSYSSREISETFDHFGAHFEVSAGFDFANISLYCPSRHLDQLLPLTDDLLHAPAYEEKELETLRNIQLQQLQVSLEKTAFVASREFRRLLFGEEHPYGRSLETGTIQAQTKDGLAGFFSEHLDRRYEIVFSGLVEEEHLQALEQYFGARSREKSPLLEPLAGTRPAAQRHIGRENSVQASIRLGQAAVGKAHPDYMGLLVLVEILGGYFGSRLMQNLREDKGYTYGIHASVSSLAGGAYTIIGADVGKQHAEPSLDEIRREIRRLQTEPVPADELIQVRNYMKGSFLSGINTPFSLADKFKGVYLQGLDYSFYDRYFGAIDRTGPEELMRLAGLYLEPDRMTEVVVG